MKTLILAALLCVSNLAYAQATGGQGVPGAGGGGGGSLPTSNALGDTLFATAASSTTYVARTTSKIPVELYGATPYTSEAAAEAGPDDTAKFQSAVTASVLGVVTCQSGMWYHVEGPVNFISNEGLIGTSNQTYGGQCGLVSNSATSHILSAVGSSGSYLAGVTLANLNIRRSVTPTTTAAAIYASFSGGMIVQNVLAYDGIYDFYRHASPGFGIGYWDHLQAGWLLAESSGTYYGFYDDSADGNAENSIILTHSAAACQNFTGSAVSYGQILTGEAVNDNRTFDFNTAGCTYGQVVNWVTGGPANNAQDIHFSRSTHDTFKTNAFLIQNIPASERATVTIDDAWMSGTGSSAAAVRIIGSSGVIVQDSQIKPTAGSAYYASGSDSLILANNQISETTTFSGNPAPVEFSGVSHSAITGNTVNATSGNFNNIVYLTGNSTYNSVVGNTLSGYSSAGNGIGIDTGSNFNNCCSANAIDTTHITSGKPVSNSGTGNGVFVAAASNPAIVATSTTGSNADFTQGAQLIGSNNLEGWSNATPTAAWDFGWLLPGGSSEGTNVLFNVYGGSSWQTAWSINPSTLAMTFAGAVTAPSYNTSGGRKGTFVCTAGGTITIANTNELITSDVIISLNTAGGTISTAPAMKTVASGTGFTVLCGAADTSTYNYDILN